VRANEGERVVEYKKKWWGMRGEARWSEGRWAGEWGWKCRGLSGRNVNLELSDGGENGVKGACELTDFTFFFFFWPIFLVGRDFRYSFAPANEGAS